MGFFSWNCSHCKESIKNAYTQYNDGIVLVTPNNVFIDRSYDGYGRINEKDIYILAKYNGDTDIINEIYKDSPKNIDIERSQAITEYFDNKFPIKALHLSCYEAILKDKYIEVKELYNMLSTSEDAEDQGFFTDEKLNQIFKDF
jgi:hypothetical protein